MAVLAAVDVLMAGPVAPVAPESPLVARGIEEADDVASPVRPELVAEDWAVAGPVEPVVAVGATFTVVAPPWPPEASVVAIEAPPTVEVVTGPVPTARTPFTAAPPGPAAASAVPPAPPAPPTATMVERLTASPLDPVWATDDALAPVLARESAVPRADAAPVSPDEPELPDVAGPVPAANEVLRMAELVAVDAVVAAPVGPVGPELPDDADGFDVADDVALPVVPVLVADD